MTNRIRARQEAADRVIYTIYGMNFLPQSSGMPTRFRVQTNNKHWVMDPGGAVHTGVDPPGPDKQTLALGSEKDTPVFAQFEPTPGANWGRIRNKRLYLQVDPLTLTVGFGKDRRKAIRVGPWEGPLKTLRRG